ncbi:alpha-1,2-fucosyltransferase [Polaribacter undariae]|uniref:Alpha-1,2-fucosyltransferase n=1 Tax=Polaribacter sejongensis TaxID=985043 RepID=A0AAJ1QVQ0_9FLAO|nr:alpha-1,2-fucosyltransferase [Polaribacter undariae]MDN3618937.1 alpha-1,2-fucosyltransferase [Polaribacter undariae]UWD33026.1 alpha-1,2-fucosyltransferase [Polaribacter undariae]
MTNYKITFSRLGSKGRLGNQLFQIASTIGMAKKNSFDYCFPKWEYSKYFEFDLKECFIDNKTFIKVREEKFEVYDWKLLNNKNINLDGWLQSEKYFDLKLTKKIFKFESIFLEKIKKEHIHFFDKKNILISVRRGDFVNHPYFYQVGFKFYIKALFNFFPDWKSRNIIFMSDDIKYCKKYYSFLKNSFFIEDLSDIEQIALGTLCDDYIISNSTFSWWIAWLGENKNTKIIRPKQNFRGEFLKKNDDKDFFPEQWIKFDDKTVLLEPKLYLVNIKIIIHDLIFDFNFYRKKYFYKFKQFIKKIIKYK